MVKRVTPLKSGYIRKKDISPSSKSNAQLKIGSKAYDKYVFDESLRTNKGKSTEQKIQNIKRFKAFEKLPQLLTNQNLSTVRSLVSNGLKFDNNPFIKEQVYRILQKEMNKNDGKRVMQFKIKGEDTYDSRKLTLRDENLMDLVNILSYGGVVVGGQQYGSDAVASLSVNEIIDFKISDIKKTGNLFKSKAGKYFKYVNNTNIDLTRYQIYRIHDKREGNGIIQRHCILHALDQSDIKPELVSRIATTFNNGMNFAKKNFHKVSDIIGHKIILKTFDGKRTNKYTFGKGNKSIELGLFQDHYFVNDITDYSNYCSLHYQEVKHEPNCKHIERKNGNVYSYRKTSNKIDSFTLIKNLFDTGNFQECHMSKFDADVHYIKEINDVKDRLGAIEHEQALYKYNDKNSDDKTSIFYADIESDTTDHHKPLMIGVVGDKNNQDVSRVKVFINDDNSKKFFEKFLKYVSESSKDSQKVIIYFHNLKYDYFVMLPFIFKHRGAPCEKEGQIYSVKIQYGKRVFELRDSYKLANFPLAKFQETFGLDKKYNKKEAIAYEYHKLTNMKTYKLSTKEYEKYLPQTDIKTFYNNLEENTMFFEYYKDNKDGQHYFNPVAYYKHYLKYDVFVLYKGIEKFQQDINAITEGKLSLFNYLTISSLTNAFMGLKGSFDGIYGVNGNLRQFISKAVTGGRVQVNELYAKKVIEGKIADYDGVSLYPSAIVRLCKEMGLPKGKGTTITVFTKQELDQYSYYIVNIKITKINKHQQLPMVSYKDENGILQYTNEINEPIICTVGRITLEDWINFQGIEYEIIDGVYWNEGYNKKMGDNINIIFGQRLIKKKEGNESMQQILKLMMNSSYGKMIMKKTDTRFNILTEEEHDNYLETWFSVIQYTEQLPNGEYKVKESQYDDSMNYGHIGVMILEYSKRIMNEVFNVANDLNCPLYYTDTDSIHCNYDDVPKIEERFRQVYGRELTGKQLGQFHIDFNLKGAKSEIYATKSIFLGKKSYIDLLESTDANGNKINGCHFRMKGIPEKSLTHSADINFNNDLLELYKYLAKGNELKVVLNPKDIKVMFEYASNRIITRGHGSFTRTLNF